jgi:hypothetical protein
MLWCKVLILLLVALFPPISATPSYVLSLLAPGAIEVFWLFTAAPVPA